MDVWMIDNDRSIDFGGRGLQKCVVSWNRDKAFVTNTHSHFEKASTIRITCYTLKKWYQKMDKEDTFTYQDVVVFNWLFRCSYWVASFYAQRNKWMARLSKIKVFHKKPGRDIQLYLHVSLHFHRDNYMTWQCGCDWERLLKQMWRYTYHFQSSKVLSHFGTTWLNQELRACGCIFVTQKHESLSSRWVIFTFWIHDRGDVTQNNYLDYQGLKCTSELVQPEMFKTFKQQQKRMKITVNSNTSYIWLVLVANITRALIG